MGQNKRQIIRHILWWFSLLLIIASVALVMFCSIATGVSAGLMLGAVGFVLFYVLLPGYVFARKMVDWKDSSSFFAYTLLFGIALNLLFYFADAYITAKLFSGLCESGAGALTQARGHAVTDWLYRIFDRKALFLGFGGAALLMAAIPLLVLDIRKKRITADTVKIDLRLGAILAVLMAVAFCSFGMVSGIGADSVPVSSSYHDVLWNISNDAALARGWPADATQYDGKLLNTNLFTNVFRACISRVTGISSAKTFGLVSPFVMLSFVVFGLDTFGKRLSKKSSRSVLFVFCFAFVGFLSAAILSPFDSNVAYREAYAAGMHTAMCNIIASALGIDLAIPAAAMMMILLNDLYRDSRIMGWRIVALFTASAVCTGGKQIFVICVGGALIGTCILRLIQGNKLRQLKKIGLCLIVIAAAFLPVYFLIVSGGEIYLEPTQCNPTYGSNVIRHDSGVNASYSYAHQYSELIIGSSARRMPLFGTLAGMLSLSDTGENILAVFMSLIHFVFSLPLTGVPFLLWCIQKFKRFKEIDETEMLLAGTAICGLIVYYVLSVDGTSQVYFYFIASIPVHLIGINWICDHNNRLNPIWKILLVLGLIAGLSSSYAMMRHYVEPGVENAILAISDQSETEDQPIWNGITSYEYNAMLWLRDNTETDAVIAVDRHYSVLGTSLRKSGDRYDVVRGCYFGHPEPNDYNSRYYYYTAYSERQAFLGSWAYLPRTAEMQKMLEERLAVNNALYDEDCLNKREIMEKNGITYIVVSRFIHPNLRMDEWDFERIFANLDITIYQLRDQ